MLIYFRKKILNNSIYDPGFFCLSLQKIIWFSYNTKRGVEIYSKDIVDFSWIYSFFKNQLLIRTKNKEELKISGFDFKEFFSLAFLVKKFFFQKIFSIGEFELTLNFLRNSKLRKRKIGIEDGTQVFKYRFFEALNFSDSNSAKKKNLVNRIQEKASFSGFLVNMKKIFFNKNLFSYLFHPQSNGFLCILPIRKKVFPLKIENFFFAKLEKRGINFYNLKKPIDCLKIGFKLINRIFARVLFGNLQKKTILFSLWLRSFKPEPLKKLNFSFPLGSLERYQKHKYRFVKRGQMFSRTIFTRKPWLSVPVISHRFREPSLILREIYETRSNKNNFF